MKYLFIIGGIIAIIVASMINKKLNRYEFENRTDGGVVRFPDYESSVRHKRNRGFASLLFSIGIICIVIGIIAAFA